MFYRTNNGLIYEPVAESFVARKMRAIYGDRTPAILADIKAGIERYADKYFFVWRKK